MNIFTFFKINSSFLFKKLFFIVIYCINFSSFSQILEINKTGEANSLLNLEELVKQVLISGECAQVDTFSSKQTGEPSENETKSYGYFKRSNNSNFPFEEGIILTSGRAYPAGNTTDSSIISYVNGTSGDSDLEKALNIQSTLDATFVKFNFVSTTNTISFRFLMASEEYNNFFECNFSDGFAFLLKEIGTSTYTNLAVLPDPEKTPVNVTNINSSTSCSKNTQYFAGYNLEDTNYGGRTKTLTAFAEVTPNTTYEIKLVIADQGDSEFDTAIFLEAGSFKLDGNIGVDQLISTNNAVCGNTKLLDADIDGSSYQWYKDNEKIDGATNKTYLANLGNGTYKVEILTSNSSCGTLVSEIQLEFILPPTATQPENIKFCDADGNGFHSFDLQALQNDTILNGQNSDTFEILYFDSEDKANENAPNTALSNPYTNPTPFSSQTIYARVQNKGATETCFAITNFQLDITPQPSLNQPTDYILCDDDTSGSNTDKINNFQLNTKDTEILGTLSSTQYNVSYHLNLLDAQTSSTTNAIDKNTYTVTNTETIYVRVENKDNPDCNTISDNSAESTFKPFQLIVAPLPIIKENPVLLQQCDSDSDKQTTFNLTLAEINLSDNPKNTFQYFSNQSDAINGTPEVSDKTSYFVDTTGEAWVRVITEFGCYAIAKINLTVSYTPDEPYNETFIECDDFLDVDGNDTPLNSDTDGITSFNFSIAPSQISTDPDVIIEFYETQQDRTQSINEIQQSQDISKYRNKNIPNTTGNKFPIYYKLISKINNNCIGLGQIYLQVKKIPLAYTPTDFELCDDALSGSTTDGKNVGINLRDKVSEILGTTQTEANYTVSFHTSETGANTNTDIIVNDTNFENTPPKSFVLNTISEQTIYVRVQDKNGAPTCFNDHISFKINIIPLPLISKSISPLAVCDIPNFSDGDPRNRLAQHIDLTIKNSEILEGKINHRVAYYNTQQDAENHNEITNLTDFENSTSLTTFPTNFNTDDPGIQTIFYRVFDLEGNKCESISYTFQLLIYPEPNIPTTISDYSDCDNISDINKDDANGINGDISLKNKIPEILANYSPSEFNDFSVTFYDTLTKAQSNDTSLALNENKFENTSNYQTIYVRVENTKNTLNTCSHTRLSFKINIKPLPSFSVMGEENIDTPQIVCLNNPSLTLEAENPISKYGYTWTNETGQLIGNTRFLEVSTAGKYTITATDLFPEGCSRKRTIIVKESNIATLKENFITVIDDANNINLNDHISVSIDTIGNYLGPGNYQFALENNDDYKRIPIIGFQDEPIFNNLEGGIYTIIVNDKNGCSPDSTLQISVIQFPKYFTPNDDGENDTWGIKGANETYYPNSRILIFNRFGELVAQVPINGKGWDGTFRGKKLPSGEYWFNIQLIPANPDKPTILKKGHFSLIRK